MAKSYKSFRLVVFSRFLGPGWKKDNKITRFFLDIILGAFWRIFAVFLVRAKGQNIVIYIDFVPLAWKKYFMQPAENCVLTSVFTRC